MCARSALIVVVLGVMSVVLTGCVTPARPDNRVVVATDYCFGSLNSDTPEGRSPGSVLVRGLTTAGFVSLDQSGTAVFNTDFGTIEKLSDAPLTVRYTVADGAMWSDGVSVTPADLLLEWAARSGRFDEVVPSVGDDGTMVLPSSADQQVVFGATSPVLVHASATPIVDGSTLTIVYDVPVADWQTALDVNVPAHVIGMSLESDVSQSDPAQTVIDAITTGDRDWLINISAAWRQFGIATTLVTEPNTGVTTGRYEISEVSDSAVVLSPRAGGETVTVRCDLDPLEQIAAVRSGDVDVAIPVDTPDIREAADKASLMTTDGEGAVLQVQLGEQVGSPFAGDLSLRAQFLGSLDPVALADIAHAIATDTVAAQFGVQARTSATSGPEPVSSEPPNPEEVVVRLLVDTSDPVRAALAKEIVQQAKIAGFQVVLVDADSTVALWSQSDKWDAALVPVTQEMDPVAGFIARWRSDGSVNVTNHNDPVLDTALDALGAQTDPGARDVQLAEALQALHSSSVVLPLIRQPEIAVVLAHDGPVIPPFTWSDTNMDQWWSWLD